MILPGFESQRGNQVLKPKAHHDPQRRIQVPKNSGPYEAKVEQTGGATPVVLEPGDEMEMYVHSGNEIKVTEVPLGTKAGASAS